MERVRIIGLGKSFGIKEVFSDVSFELKSGERIGLVGPNGAGKSTLVKCILGLEEYDAGQVVCDRATTFGYLQQDISLGNESLEEEIQKAWADVRHIEEELQALTARLEAEEATEDILNRLNYLQERFEFLDGYSYEEQSRRIAYGLGFSDEDLRKQATEFSGGQKTRINLAKALVRRPDFLFLDEPTNHLDVEMIEWLEHYLSSYRGGILLVSHDRYFMDKVVTGVVHLEHKRLTSYKGNYSKYVEQRSAHEKAQLVAYNKQQEHIKKTEAYIDKYRAGIKSKMARGRQSQLDRLERIEAPRSSATLQFKFPKAEMSADKVLILDHLSVGYNRNPVLEDLHVTIRRGEHVAILGENGAGKSTILKTIMGELPSIDGHITIGNRVHVGYFSQEHEELHMSWIVLDEIFRNFDMTEEEARSALGSFLFRGDEVFKLVGDLSGGERARLALLQLFLKGFNFLILDEPTNHLDIPTREVVERALADYEGTCLIVSHDRYFLDRVANRIIDIEEGKLTEYEGNYSAYKEKIEEMDLRKAVEERERIEAMKGHSSLKESVVAHGGTTISRRSDRLVGGKGENDIEVGQDTGRYRENTDNLTSMVPVSGSEAQKKPNSYMKEQELQRIEENIARLEATIKMYNVQLLNPEFQSNPAMYEEVAAHIETAHEELEKLYERWEFLSEQ